MKVYVGCSGWYYGHWVERFYPSELKRNDWLSYYALHFPIVEINTTFYHLPKKSTVENWCKHTPEEFSFIVKGSRYITHERTMDGTEADTDALLDRLGPLKERLKHLLWQYPPSFELSQRRLHHLERHITHLNARGMQSSFEFRHQSWLHRDVSDMLRSSGCGFVSADAPAFYNVRTVPITCGTLYFRRHGHNGDYWTSYTDEQLETLAKTVVEYSCGGEVESIYIMYNNDCEGHAVKDALRLMDSLERYGLGSQLIKADLHSPSLFPPIQRRLF